MVCVTVCTAVVNTVKVVVPARTVVVPESVADETPVSVDPEALVTAVLVDAVLVDAEPLVTAVLVDAVFVDPGPLVTAVLVDPGLLVTPVGEETPVTVEVEGELPPAVTVTVVLITLPGTLTVTVLGP